MKRPYSTAYAAKLEQIREHAEKLETALRAIAEGMGNLSLEQMGDAGVHGINDGKQRAIYLETYVRIAREALAE